MVVKRHPAYVPAWTLPAILSFAGLLGSLRAADLDVNGDFETKTALGWTEWSASWALEAPTYDYAFAENPREGTSALHQKAPNGSFGLYQEVCVEPGKPLKLEWSWMGKSDGNGWWEVLIVDGPYSIEAVDDPANHPETFMADKWEKGFGGPYPEPSQEWADGIADFTPTSDRVTLVLKCGANPGPVEAWFDAVKLTQDTSVLEVTQITPAMGKTAGGDDVVVLGKVFPEGSAVALGGQALVDGVRASSCSFAGKTPAHDAGLVDVVVTVGEGSAALPNAFRYVAPPTVLSIEPATGPVEGGTDVTIKGESFVTSGVSRIRVTFGSRALVGMSVQDETTITGRTPAGDPGAVDVTVGTPFGEVVVAGGFTYAQVGTRFIRGNCDGDPSLNITDAISLLGFLFLGSAEPVCLEGCNTNDDGEINITDGISILNFLFTGGPAPAAPYPGCGTDPTDGKGCLASHSGC